MNASLRRTFSLLFCSLFCCGAVFSSDELLVCGWDEVFSFDVRAAETGRFEKLWSWRAKERSDLPEAFRTKFGSTDDCRPIDKGRKVLISSSGGACALVEKPSGKVLWYAAVPNAHGVEWLPKGRIVCAASTHAKGNKLMLFDKDRPDVVIWDDALHSAHGVVWDAKRERLWAIGFKELRCYALKDWNSKTPSLALEKTHPLPDEDGHDLSAVPGSNDLILTTHHHTYLFDRETREFRLHPELKDKLRVKGISIHPSTGRLVYVQAQEKNWWNSQLEFLGPAGLIRLPAEKLYRPRWVESARNGE
jgi:hypothetical protein